MRVLFLVAYLYFLCWVKAGAIKGRGVVSHGVPHTHLLQRNETSRFKTSLQGRYKATWNREFKHPWREAGPPNHLDDKVDSDQ